MTVRESKSNTVLNQYLREKKLYCFYELKVSKGHTFAFSKIEEHQDEALQALEQNGLVWKLSDEDSRKKPCDGFCLPPLPTYLIIRFDGQLCFVPYSEIVHMKSLGRVSITKDEAIGLADRVVHVKS